MTSRPLTSLACFGATGLLSLVAAFDLIVTQAARGFVLVHGFKPAFSVTAWGTVVFASIFLAQIAVTYLAWLQHRIARSNFYCRRLLARWPDHIMFWLGRRFHLVGSSPQPFFDAQIRIAPEAALPAQPAGGD